MSGYKMFTRIILISGLFLIAACLPGGRIWAAGPVDHTAWQDLLGRYVRDGVVDYAGFKAEEDRLDQYLRLLERVNPDLLDRDEAYAFYINVYNAWTVRLILTRWPDVRSIKDLGSVFQSPWKKKIVRLFSTVTTLDQVEHGILRPRFQDARVHFAVNCASKSCPPLRSEPYVGARLNEQLDEAASNFINDQSRNGIKGSVLFLSKIFDWYQDDFGDLVPFLLKYADDDFKRNLKGAGTDIKIKYLPYDWSLNDG